MLDHGHRAALPPLLIAVVDRHFIPSGALNELTHDALPSKRNDDLRTKINIFTILLRLLLHAVL